MLHITNGDSAVDRLRAGGVGEEILPWRDVLHEGPVPAGASPAELRDLRARFIRGRGWAGDEVVAELADRDDRLERGLAAAERGDEVVLWFEHDLYDQLQLLDVLERVARHPGARVSLVQTDDYLGTIDAARVPRERAARRPVSPAMLALARRAWAAFGGDDPRAIERLLKDREAAWAQLPHLAPALRRHLEELPSTRDGLSRSERQALEAVAAGHVVIGDAYVAAHHAREASIFLGDVVFASYLATLGAPSRPLVTLADGTPIAAPARADERTFWKATLRLTPLGESVLRGDADRVRTLGIDRWLGGVHLAGHEARWRWDGERVVGG